MMRVLFLLIALSFGLYALPVHAQDQATPEQVIDVAPLVTDDNAVQGQAAMPQDGQIDMAQPAADINAPAQSPTPQESADAAKAAGAAKAQAEQDKTMQNYPSLFFTYWQHEAIKEAKKSRGGHVRAPTQAELDAMVSGDEDLMPKKEPGIREISLSGIVYEGPDKWTVWLNGQRITPNALPKEILDLRVFKDYIEVKWLDEFSSQIFPIRLRAHERFNLDMRIFLPG